MTFILKDRVAETSTTTGTGTLTLLGAKTGYQSFSAVGNSDTTFYTIVHQTLSEWEVGIGTYTSSGTTLSRDTILSSSNSGSAVSFSAGTKDVFVCSPANYGSPFIYKDSTNPGVGAANETILSSTAGNARGKGAVDLQLNRYLATQVASGSYSFAAGACATANNYGSVAIGSYSSTSGPTASGDRSVAVGSKPIIDSSSPTSVCIGWYGNVFNGPDSVVLSTYNSSSYGAYSVSIGNRNYGAGYSSRITICGGRQNYSNSYNSYASSFAGHRVLLINYGQIAHASGRFVVNGDAQTSQHVLRGQTTDNLPLNLTLNGGSDFIKTKADSTYAYSILITARRIDASDESAGYKHEGAIDRNATTEIVTDNRTILGEDNAWGSSILTSGSDFLLVEVTGENSKTINWVAFVRTVEVTG